MTDVQVATNTGSLNSDVALVIPVAEGESAGNVPHLGGAERNELERVMRRNTALTDTFELTMLSPEGEGPQVLLVGVGKAEGSNTLQARRLAGVASRYLTGRGFRRLAIVIPDEAAVEPAVEAMVEGAIGGAYNLGLKKTGKRNVRQLDEVILVVSEDKQQLVERAAHVGAVVGDAKTLARNLVNLPPNEISPTSLAQSAQQLAAEHGLQCEVLDEDRMRELGMGSLLGVSSGSREPARLIVLRYGDQNASTRLAAVGKGLTFDSGGLSLKTAEGMETMKSDMAGAAAVIAGMVAVAKLAPKGVAVTGYVGSTENMPGGEAMRPGDILTAMNGKTIEVLNTDAEGRLVLADVLSYAVSQGATHIVDFATLTGAAVVALGSAATLATGRPSEWVDEVVGAADGAAERAWPMPQYPDYLDAMRSEVADLKNTGGRGGGALNAAAFLGEFVDSVPWTHMDIAGTAFAKDSKPYAAAGATGEGVGTIVSLARRMADTATT